jgi:recombination protein RecA
MLPARVDRSVLLSALRERRLDRTLTSTLPVPDRHDAEAAGATGMPALDARLGGGLPRGHLSEIIGPRSSGRTSLLHQAMAAATARGELVALVDALDMLDVASAAAAGVELSRLLWIRGHVVTSPGLCRDLNLRAMEQAVKALGLVLQAGNFGLVVLDLGDAPHDMVRRLPFTTWLRLQRMVEGSQTICVLAGDEPMSRSSAGLSIKLQPNGAADQGRHAGRFGSRLFEGLDVEARISRARVQMLDSHALPLSTEAVCHV